MRRSRVPCLAIALVAGAIASDAQASRCVDQIARFALQLDVPVGAPGQEGPAAQNAELGPPPALRGTASLPSTTNKPPHGPMGTEGNVSLHRDDGLEGDGKPRGKALKAHAKSVLSSLLNAALAADEVGRSRACFERLNVAHAVSLIAPAYDNDSGEGEEWR